MKWERIAQGKGLQGSAENSSALFLEPSPKLWKVLQGIFPDGSTPYRDTFCEGCLVLLANGKHGGKRLCLLTADWNLVYQSQEELICVTPGSIDEKAIEKIKRNTRVYSRKQMTWFKRDPQITWFSPEQESEIMSFIKNQIF